MSARTDSIPFAPATLLEPIFIPTVEAMAEAMVTHHSNCTDELLQALGFPLSFQREHKDAAVALANKSFVQQVEDASTRTDDQVAAEMRVATGEMMPTMANLITGWRYRGFTDRQINRLARRVVHLAARDFLAILPTVQ